MNAFALFMLFVVGTAAAQTANVTPQSANIIADNVTVEIRLKGPATATNLFPTVKLIEMKFTPLDASAYTFSVPCWNKASACPKVTGVTVKVLLAGKNVTVFTRLCGLSTECVLPAFPAIQPKPGEAYSFSYSRIKAAWVEPPSVK